MRLPSTQPSRKESDSLGRRRFLRRGAGTALAVVTATAGCLTESDSTADTPTEAVELYFEALEDGDREAANQYAHEDGEYYIDDDAAGMFEQALEAQAITITGPAEVSLETAVENKFDAPDDERVDRAIEDEKAAIETLQDEYGFSDHAYVRHEARTDEGLTFNPTFLLFETDDGWLIWSLPTVPLQ